MTGEFPVYCHQSTHIIRVTGGLLHCPDHSPEELTPLSLLTAPPSCIQTVAHLSGGLGVSPPTHLNKRLIALLSTLLRIATPLTSVLQKTWSWHKAFLLVAPDLVSARLAIGRSPESAILLWTGAPQGLCDTEWALSHNWQNVLFQLETAHADSHAKLGLSPAPCGPCVSTTPSPDFAAHLATSFHSDAAESTIRQALERTRRTLTRLAA